MMHLSLALLGPVHIQLNGHDLGVGAYARVRALLLYLVVEADRPQQREALASLLWPDLERSVARSNLRQTLSTLREQLGERHSNSSFLLITRQSVQFDLTSDFSLDIADFRRSIASAQAHNHKQLSGCPACIKCLEDALKLYRGDFLDQFSLNDTVSFDEWIVLQREQLHRMAVDSLGLLASAYEQQQAFADVRRIASRQVELEPWHEEAHRQLMRVFALSGERSAALAQYERCRQLLATHLRIEPDEETIALYEHIKSRREKQHILGATLEYAEQPPIENPYKGLRAFKETEAGDFFGRDRLIQELLSLLRETGPLSRFLAVVGPSGCGKSSVVRAGLIPAIQRGALSSGKQQIIKTLIPGAQPFVQLATALSHGGREQIAQLATHLAQDDYGLATLIKELVPEYKAVEITLVIDQFEEVFTLLTDEALRVHLLDSLVNAILAPDTGLRIIITLRADFYDRPLQYHRFGALLRQRSVAVLPLTSEELLHAIVRPAQRVGVTLTDELIAALLHDVSSQPGSLPFLQYALTEVFSRREGHLLTLDAYMASGGVHEALTKRADTLFTDFDASCQEATRQLFLRLITLGEGSADTRRRVRYAELVSTAQDDPQGSNADPSSAMRMVIEQYGRYRLLTRDRDALSNEPTIEVAHEALLRTWPRLQGWLESSRTAVRSHRRLSDATNDWLLSGCDVRFLAYAARLDEFEALKRGSQLSLNQEEAAYLRASEEERERQLQLEHERQEHELDLALQSAAAQQSAAQRLRLLVGVLGIFLVVAIGLSALAFSQRQSANANFTRSEAQRLAAEADTLAQRGGDPELIALLSIRSLQTQHTPQGEAALDRATTLDYPQKLFIGHVDTLTSIAFAPDGQTALTASYDTSIRLWHLKTGAIIRSFQGHSAAVLSVAFSPDGKTIASGSIDRSIRIWDTETAAQLLILRGHAGPITSVAFSPDGRWIATASTDQTAGLWDAKTGIQLRVFKGHRDALSSLAFSADGTLLLTGSHDRTARLWDLASGQQLHVLVGHSDWITSVGFAHHGHMLVTGSVDTTLGLWDSSTAQEIRRFQGHTGAITSVAFAPDDQSILSASEDSTIRLWSTASGLVERTIAGPSEGVTSAAIAPDGQSLLAAHANSMRMWTIEKQSITAVFVGHSGPVTSVALTADGQHVVTGGADGTVRLWSAANGRLEHSFIGHTGPISSVAIAADGQAILSGSADQTVRLWDIHSTAAQHIFQIQAEVSFVAFMPTKQEALVCDMSGKTSLLNLQAGTSVQEFVDHISGRSIATYLPASQSIMTVDEFPTIRFWDMRSGKAGQSISLKVDSSGAVLEPGERLLIITNRSPMATSMSFSSDGSRVLTGNYDTSARLWNTTTGALLQTFKGHSDSVVSSTFAPDQRSVLTGSTDKTARLWDIGTGQELRYLSGHTQPVLAVAFAPDQRSILTGSGDGSARLWMRDYHDAIHSLCTQLQRDFSERERLQFSIADHTPTCPTP